MYGAINGSYINFGGLNAAGGEAANVGYCAYTQDDQTFVGTASSLVDADSAWTQDDQTFSATVTAPIDADCLYIQEDQTTLGTGSSVVNVSVSQTEQSDSILFFCENTMVRKVLGSSLTNHSETSNLTIHTTGSSITGVH